MARKITAIPMVPKRLTRSERRTLLLFLLLDFDVFGRLCFFVPSRDGRTDERQHHIRRYPQRDRTVVEALDRPDHPACGHDLLAHVERFHEGARLCHPPLLWPDEQQVHQWDEEKKR